MAFGIGQQTNLAGIDLTTGLGGLSSVGGLSACTEKDQAYFGGNVGIGTARPLQLLHTKGDSGLQIERTADQTNFRIYNTSDEWIFSSTYGDTGDYDPINFQTGAGNARLYIASLGNVGIGTAAPSRKFHLIDAGAEFQVYNDSSRTVLALAYSNSNKCVLMQESNKLRITPLVNTVGIELQWTDNTGTSYPALFVAPGEAKIGIGTNSPAQALDVAGNIVCGVASGTLYLGGVDGDQYISGDAASNYMTFSTGNAERIRIKSDGLVGIGTAAPTYNLEVDGGAAQTHLRISTTGTDANEACLILSNSSKTAYNDGIVIGHGAGVTRFADLAGETQMSIAMTNSRVGIGTFSRGHHRCVRSGTTADRIYFVARPQSTCDTSRVRRRRRFVRSNDARPGFCEHAALPRG